MGDFPKFEHSNKAVLRVGEALKGTLSFTDGKEAEVRKIFEIANNWRDSHAFPMRSIRGTVSSRIGILGIEGVTAARIKRMPSIRRKLQRLPYKLNQIQDLGGVRAVVATIDEVPALVAAIKNNNRHEVRDEYDYIGSPKIGGYRSVHLVTNFQGNDADTEVFNGRRIEIQVRSRLQHSWATAVEAIGLIKQQDMKAGEGDEEWLRFFELMSAEFALTEGCPIPENLPDRERRIKEIKGLNDQLGAIQILDDMRHASRAVEKFTVEQKRAEYYLLEYNHEQKTVIVKPKFQAIDSFESYGEREKENYESGNEYRSTVLVEADKIGDLREAYPNYFGDVEYFIKNLRRVIHGENAIEYKMPKNYKTPRLKEKPGDPSWLYRKPRHPWL